MLLSNSEYRISKTKDKFLTTTVIIFFINNKTGWTNFNHLMPSDAIWFLILALFKETLIRNYSNKWKLTVIRIGHSIKPPNSFSFQKSKTWFWEIMRELQKYSKSKTM